MEQLSYFPDGCAVIVHYEPYDYPGIILSDSCLIQDERDELDKLGNYPVFDMKTHLIVQFLLDIGGKKISQFSCDVIPIDRLTLATPESLKKLIEVSYVTPSKDNETIETILGYRKLYEAALDQLNDCNMFFVYKNYYILKHFGEPKKNIVTTYGSLIDHCLINVTEYKSTFPQVLKSMILLITNKQNPGSVPKCMVDMAQKMIAATFNSANLSSWEEALAYIYGRNANTFVGTYPFKYLNHPNTVPMGVTFGMNESVIPEIDQQQIEQGINIPHSIKDYSSIVYNELVFSIGDIFNIVLQENETLDPNLKNEDDTFSFKCSMITRIIEEKTNKWVVVDENVSVVLNKDKLYSKDIIIKNVGISTVLIPFTDFPKYINLNVQESKDILLKSVCSDNKEKMELLVQTVKDKMIVCHKWLIVNPCLTKSMENPQENKKKNLNIDTDFSYNEDGMYMGSQEKFDDIIQNYGINNFLLYMRANIRKLMINCGYNNIDSLPITDKPLSYSFSLTQNAFTYNSQFCPVFSTINSAITNNARLQNNGTVETIGDVETSCLQEATFFETMLAERFLVQNNVIDERINYVPTSPTGPNNISTSLKDSVSMSPGTNNFINGFMLNRDNIEMTPGLKKNSTSLAFVSPSAQTNNLITPKQINDNEIDSDKNYDDNDKNIIKNENEFILASKSDLYRKAYFRVIRALQNNVPWFISIENSGNEKPHPPDSLSSVNFITTSTGDRIYDENFLIEKTDIIFYVPSIDLISNETDEDQDIIKTVNENDENIASTSFIENFTRASYINALGVELYKNLKKAQFSQIKPYSLSQSKHQRVCCICGQKSSPDMTMIGPFVYNISPMQKSNGKLNSVSLTGSLANYSAPVIMYIHRNCAYYTPDIYYKDETEIYYKDDNNANDASAKKALKKALNKAIKRMIEEKDFKKYTRKLVINSSSALMLKIIFIDKIIKYIYNTFPNEMWVQLKPVLLTQKRVSLKCTVCKKPCALIGCWVSTCQHTTHYLCAEKNGWVFKKDTDNDKEYYCPKHVNLSIGK